MTDPLPAIRSVVRLVLALSPVSRLAYESTLDGETLAEPLEEYRR
ncbi:MAG: hypothetical protein ACLTSX_03155 [Collinsella sp.]